MPLPRVLTMVGAAEHAAARSLANVKTAVDPLLAFVNGTFQVASDGTLNVVRTVRTLTANAIKAASGTITTLNATTANLTNVNATTVAATGGVSGATVTGTSVVSGGGFKTQIDLGVAWISSAAVNTYYRTKKYSQNDTANNQFNVGTLFQTPFAGSLIGVSAFSSGTAGGTATIGIWQDVSVGAGAPSSTPNITYTGVNCAQYVGSVISYAKGKYPVAYNDYFQVGVSFNTAGNQFMQVNLWFEFGA